MREQITSDTRSLEHIKDLIVKELFPILQGCIPGFACEYVPSSEQPYWGVKIDVPLSQKLSPDAPRDVQGVHVEYVDSLSP